MIRNVYRKLFVSRFKPMYMNKNKRYSKFEIGECTYGSPNVIKEKDYGNLKIGKFCSIASGVTFFLIGDHRMDWVSTYPFKRLYKKASCFSGWPKVKGDIIVGNDVWIGFDAVILGGITIGNGAVVGAYSVVAKDIPPYAIVVGNPARIIKYRFGNEIINQLNKIAWWDWPIEKIEEAFPQMLSTDIEAFINKYRTL